MADPTAQPAPLFAAAARAYRTAGWPAVLPLPHAKKTPPPDGYTGRQGAWPDDQQTDRWIERFPDGNLALRLPPDVIGIDVDNYGDKPGAHTLAALEHELGPLPSTKISTSRADGVSGIRLYRTPQRPAWHDPGPGIEIIHSGWRYVIAAPSIHDTTGQPYRWIDQATGEILTGAPTPASLPQLPNAWAERLSTDRDNTKATVTRHQVDDWMSQLATGNPCTATRNALDQFHTDLRAGGARHDAMLEATGRLARALERGHRGGPAALTEAHHAFVTAVTGDGTRNPQQAEQEWRRAIEGAYALVTASPTPAHDRGCRCTDGPGLPAMPVTTLDTPTAATDAQEQPSGEPTATALEQLRADPDYQQLVSQEATRIVARDDARQLIAAQQAEQAPPPPLIDLPTFLSTPDPDLVYRIEDLWPADGRVLLAAQYKAGKTTTVGNLLRSLADGEPLFDTFDVDPPDGRIVLIDDELHENTLRRWLRDQGIVDTGMIDVVTLRGKLSSFNILDETVRAAWAERIRNANAAVVILDCLRPIIDALGLSEDKDVGKILTAFDELLDLAGATEAIVVHHMGHQGERSRGDSRLRDWPDAEWKIVRESEDGVDDPAAPRYFSAFGRDVDVPERQLILDGDGRRLRLAGGTRREVSEWKSVRRLVQAVINEPGIGIGELRERLGANRDVVRKTRDRAIHEGLIRAEHGTRKVAHHPLVDTCPEVPPRSDTPSVTVLQTVTEGNENASGPSMPDHAVRRDASRSDPSSPIPYESASNATESERGPTRPDSTRDAGSDRFTRPGSTPVPVGDGSTGRNGAPGRNSTEPAGSVGSGPQPLPPCTVCGKPTRDTERRIHAACRTGADR